MTKILGALLILLAGGGMAVTLAGFEKKRLSVLDGWLELLTHIRGQIDCYLMPLDDILNASDTELLRACGGNGKCRSLRALFQASFPYLDRESRRLLSSLLREIGSSYREEQLKRCDFYLDALRMRREKIFEELPSRLKTGVTISICTALGVTVLLW